MFEAWIVLNALSASLKVPLALEILPSVHASNCLQLEVEKQCTSLQHTPELAVTADAQDAWGGFQSTGKMVTVTLWDVQCLRFECRPWPAGMEGETELWW